jgi:hypothetical protein
MSQIRGARGAAGDDFEAKGDHAAEVAAKLPFLASDEASPRVGAFRGAVGG